LVVIEVFIQDIHSSTIYRQQKRHRKISAGAPVPEPSAIAFTGPGALWCALLEENE
jgi:hypothetical protein